MTGDARAANLRLWPVHDSLDENRLLVAPSGVARNGVEGVVVAALPPSASREELALVA